MNNEIEVEKIEKVEKVKPKVIKNNNSNGFWIKLLVMICLIAIGAAGMYGVIKLMPGTTIVNKSEKEVTVNENGIADAVDKIYDAVVVVENYKSDKLYATGTGFVFKADGNKYYIMTNYHVIDGANKINVIFTNKDSITTEVVGGDKYADIAVLSFESKNDIKVAEIGSSIDARLGDTTFAVGAPLSSSTYSWSVTRGIVSGKDRMVEVSTTNSNSSDYIMKVLQTDTAINNGNSGGPLCNSNGQVIGITNMKLVSSGVEGMGFAIPIEDALEFATKIINGDSIERPYLGISMFNVTETAYLNYYHININENVTYGVVVAGTVADSSAEAAGLKVGDVIQEIAGAKVNNSAELKYQLYMHSVGDKVTLKINRNGTEKNIDVTLKSES